MGDLERLSPVDRIGGPLVRKPRIWRKTFLLAFTISVVFAAYTATERLYLDWFFARDLVPVARNSIPSPTPAGSLFKQHEL
jgi:hypothetical protein